MSYGGPAPQFDASTGEELRTIFLTGFPADVKERELNNLFRFIPGYQVRMGTMHAYISRSHRRASAHASAGLHSHAARHHLAAFGTTQASQMNWKNDQAQGFAMFTSGTCAALTSALQRVIETAAQKQVGTVLDSTICSPTHAMKGHWR